MTTKRIAAVFLALVALLLPAAVFAQDFHVETVVDDLAHVQPRELSRSMTLFHAGNVYDFIHNVGELIVFQPAQNQFVLLNTRQRRSAVAHVDEIKKKLNIAREALGDHVERLKLDNQPGAQIQLEQILFEFAPHFEGKLTQTSKGPLLDLKSKYIRYQVLCAAPPSRELADVYLQYADWISRLNYVVSPGRILPEQRIYVNERLRQSNLMPVEVTFTGNVGGPIHIRAQHRIYWELNDKDRELIREWDAWLGSNEIKRVNLQEYQRSLLLSQTSQRH